MTLGEFVVFLRALKPDSVHWTGSALAVTKSNVCGTTIQLIIDDDGDALLIRITHGEIIGTPWFWPTEELVNVLPRIEEFLDPLAVKGVK